MRFNQYLGEALSLKQLKTTHEYNSDIIMNDTLRSEFDKFWPTILRDCKPYISLLSKNFTMQKNALLWRGMEISGHYGLKKRRKNRRPVDTDTEISAMVDEVMEELYGWKPRSEGVFTTSLSTFAMSYGRTFMVFPKGRFEYLWSPTVKDSYSEFSSSKFAARFGRKIEPVVEKEWVENYSEGKQGSWEVNGMDYDLLSARYRPKKGDTRQDAINYFVEIGMKTPAGVRDGGEVIRTYVEKRILWSPDVSKGMVSRRYSEEKFGKYRGVTMEVMEDLLINDMKYQDDGFGKALMSGHEVILNVDSYYYINGSYESLIQKAIWGSV